MALQPPAGDCVHLRSCHEEGRTLCAQNSTRGWVTECKERR